MRSFSISHPEPAGKTVHILHHGAQGPAHASSHFIAIWLLAHGLLKPAMAIELLRDKTRNSHRQSPMPGVSRKSELAHLDENRKPR